MAERNIKGGWDITDEEARQVIELSEQRGCCGGACGCSDGGDSSPVRGRLFKGYRPQPPAEYAEKGITNSGSEPDYEGIIFSDGTVAIRWLTQYRSVSIWQSWDDFYRVHGHPEYGTTIIFE
jgi:hypothetical protein